MKHLVTPRLLMRPFSENDLGDLHSLCSDFRVMQYIGDGKPFTEEQSKRCLEKIIRDFDRFGYGRFAVFERKEKRFIGRCGLTTLENSDLLELDYLFLPDSWGKGYATEASMEVLRTALGEWGLNKIVAVAKEDNKASIRVMDKLGMNYTGRERFYDTDVMLYTIENRKIGGGPIFQTSYRQRSGLSMPAL